ncbi:epimerase [Bacteroides sp. AM07-16]|nr:epimerase [Bacteroides sp. AM07-16]
MKYFSKKTAKTFADCYTIYIFAAVIIQKEMKTFIVNTYWWWRSVQLKRS